MIPTEQPEDPTFAFLRDKINDLVATVEDHEKTIAVLRTRCKLLQSQLQSYEPTGHVSQGYVDEAQKILSAHGVIRAVAAQLEAQGL